MSIKNDLALAYHMGYDDALAKRKPDASQTQVLAPDDFADENAKLRELLTFYLGCLTKGHVNCESCAISGEDDCGHGRMVIKRARELGIEVYQ